MRLMQMGTRQERDVAVAMAYERGYVVETAHCDESCFYIMGRRRRSSSEARLFTIQDWVARDIQTRTRELIQAHLR